MEDWETGCELLVVGCGSEEEIKGGVGGIGGGCITDSSCLVSLIRSPKEEDSSPPSPETSGFGEVNGLLVVGDELLEGETGKSLGLLTSLKLGDKETGAEDTGGLVLSESKSPKVTDVDFAESESADGGF